jgi:polyphosphate kinase
MKSEHFNRELSWLSFNYRVLQEAKDKSVPLHDRIKFLAIFSSNLDEFFRVRVASLRSLLDLKKKKRDEISFDPELLLKRITRIVNKQQNEFGLIYRNQIIPELNAHNVFPVNDLELDNEQELFVQEYFNRNLIPHLYPQLLSGKKVSLFLKNKSLYLAVILKNKKGSNLKNRTAYAIVEIPADKFPRFIVLPKSKGRQPIIFLDDIVRKNLSQVFPGYEVDGTFAVKLTRDAELYIDDEFSGDLLTKIRESLSKRHTGVPCRFLYDETMPKELLRYLRLVLSLDKKDLVAGARYHNFSDLFSFPNLIGKEVEYEQKEPLSCSDFDRSSSFFPVIKEKDIILYYPYHKYDYIINFLNEAADDEKVRSIKITLYRTASESRIVKALCNAALKGKDVTAFIEVKARFDEEANFKNADELKRAGVKVLFSFPGLKVHAKICLISRRENDTDELYAYLSTGNFNEKTAKVYSDFGFFTYNKKITVELLKVFRFLSKESETEVFENLFVAPFNLRDSLYALIENEIQNALEGKKASITLKLNSLENKKIIKRLYKASSAGVKIRIVVRGICGLIPGVKGLSENIKITSIVDRYLEHSRVFIFHNNGEEKIYLASADWMTRNLKRRVELCFPVYDPEIRKLLKEIVSLQIRDNKKSRIINKMQSNPYVKGGKSNIRFQFDVRKLLLKQEKKSELVQG